MSRSRNKRSADPERANFAFYSMDAPGRGIEIWFSEYVAFALLVGLRLMQHSKITSFRTFAPGVDQSILRAHA